MICQYCNKDIKSQYCKFIEVDQEHLKETLSKVVCKFGTPGKIKCKNVQIKE